MVRIDRLQLVFIYRIARNSTMIRSIVLVGSFKDIQCTHSFTYTKRMNPHLTNKGSNPSPGAHLWKISTGFKTHGCEREATTVVGLGERGLQLNTAKTWDVIAAEGETKKRTIMHLTGS
jgi:hypothetical protein